MSFGVSGTTLGARVVVVSEEAHGRVAALHNAPRRASGKTIKRRADGTAGGGSSAKERPHAEHHSPPNHEHAGGITKPHSSSLSGVRLGLAKRTVLSPPACSRNGNGSRCRGFICVCIRRMFPVMLIRIFHIARIDRKKLTELLKRLSSAIYIHRVGFLHGKIWRSQ